MMKRVKQSDLTNIISVVIMMLSVLSLNAQNEKSKKLQSLLFNEGNPVIKNKYTGDPAVLVYRDTVWMFAGHDECKPEGNFYEMHEWLIYSSTDMVNWTEQATVPVNLLDWAIDDAWAAQAIERNGKFYWYVTVSHKDIPGKAIGVLVADHPKGPWKDALGKALITNDMTTQVDITWDDIDPTVMIDDDGQAYLFWGNTTCKYVKLKENMIEMDGTIKTIDNLPFFTEAPWIHKHNGWYYLSYAYQFPEKIAYAMSRNIEGPWEFKGILNELAGNCNTNHQAIIEFKNKWYFIYHNGATQTQGGSFRRSVCVDYLNYNKDGSLNRVVMTTEGVAPAQNK